MDEVDTFLDAENVAEISTFLQQKLNLFAGPARMPTQVLIVSHKEDLARETDSLVGVCMINKSHTSKAYTVNLSEQ